MVADRVSGDAGSTLLIPAEPPASNLGTDKITRILDELFKWPNASGQYAIYFLLLSSRTVASELKNNVANATDIASGNLVSYFPYGEKAGYKIKVQSIRDLKEFGYPFSKKSNPNADPNDANYIKLDAFAVLVPIPVAQLVAACFTHGLVTRLILGEYFRAWSKEVDDAQAFAKTFKRIPPLLDWTKQEDTHFGADEAAYLRNESFDTAITRILQVYPVQPAGLLLGWKAGLELDGTDGDAVGYKQCVWSLLNSRFKISEIGGMVGFTLNYLSGYIKNERIIEVVEKSAQKGETKDAVSPAHDVSEILTKLSNDKGANFAGDLLGLFHSNLVAQFYALSQNQNPGFLPDMRQRSLARLAGFLRGFQIGSTTAADEVLGELFSLAYGIGYKNGFRDGYGQGYAAGWKDGYASGYATAWKEATSVIDRLQNELATAKTQKEMWIAIGKTVDLGKEILPYLSG
jgi:hypothetical protein